jgi:aminopeptidase N
MVEAFENSGFSKNQIKDIIDRWSEHNDYPLIKVSLARRAKLRLEQLLPSGHPLKPEKFHWPLRFKVVFSSENGHKPEIKEVPMFSFGNDKTTIELDLPSWFDSSAGATDRVSVIVDEPALHYFMYRYSDELKRRSSLA